MDTCPQCGTASIEYLGETYDDEEYLGATYECQFCDFHFTISPEEQRYLDDQHGE